MKGLKSGGGCSEKNGERHAWRIANSKPATCVTVKIFESKCSKSVMNMYGSVLRSIHGCNLKRDLPVPLLHGAPLQVVRLRTGRVGPLWRLKEKGLME